MKIKRKTVLNVLLILFVISFFVTPVGYWGKVWATRLFAPAPEIQGMDPRQKLTTYDWKLRDAGGKEFNFRRSRDKVVFINLWASWLLPSAAELKGIQHLVDDYGNKVDFYIITNEERRPVEEFMEKNDYTFPVAYRIMEENAPLDLEQVPATYIIDREGFIRLHHKGNADWDTKEVRELLDSLLVR